MSHKNGKQVRRLRKKSTLVISAEAHRIRRALRDRIGAQPDAIEAARLAALADSGEEPAGAGEAPSA
jgi:large subunit ribosomal protein L35